MIGVRQGWLVAMREFRERSRSRAFQVSMVVMLLVVVAVIAVPSLLENGGGTKKVGLAGTAPSQLRQIITVQGAAAGSKVRVQGYYSLAAGEEAVRRGKLDVLIVDANRLEWRRAADEQLRSLVIGAIQLVAVQQRASAAGIGPEALASVLAPVPVSNVELGQVAGRSPGDETAALVMTIVLLFTLSTYGGLVLTGVVEEKSSRVVEVLLARMPARTLLAGKVLGIGLLGLAQVGLTALAALAASASVKSVDLPAVRGSVLAWAVVWFVLGYCLYAMVYGALGSLASRIEDAQAVAAPVTVVLLAGYFVSFAAIGSPDSGWARLVSYLPVTAPFAMPNRIAMGSPAWWEPVLAAVLALAAIGGLVLFGGRVYAGAILHGGPALKLREAWRLTSAGGHGDQPDSGLGPRGRLRRGRAGGERHRHPVG